MASLLGSLPGISDLPLSRHGDHEGPGFPTLTLSSMGWHIMKVGRVTTSPSPGWILSSHVCLCLLWAYFLIFINRDHLPPTK